MSSDPRIEWSDEEVLGYFRKWAVAYSKCGFNTLKANKILEDELHPAYELLKGRGDGALRKLLLLTEDQNQTIRWLAAGYAYEVDPIACRRVLEQIMKVPGINGIMAWATLAGKNLDALPDPPRW